MTIAVNAGIDKILVRPCTDLSLFAEVSNTATVDILALWTVVSGPGTVVFSAPWALHTSVTFSATGNYMLQISASDGNAVATDGCQVTVLAAKDPAVQSYYIDPNYNGANGASDGS